MEDFIQFKIGNKYTKPVEIKIVFMTGGMENILVSILKWESEKDLTSIKIKGIRIIRVFWPIGPNFIINISKFDKKITTIDNTGQKLIQPFINIWVKEYNIIFLHGKLIKKLHGGKLLVEGE